MTKDTVFVGLDVHRDTIAAAVAMPDGSVRSVGTIPNDPDAIAKLIKKLGALGELAVCYEAGPTGYVVYWQLVKLGIGCVVIAPSLVPEKPGDRVKTDRRDAEKLARCYRNGDLTGVWVPTPEHEALRDVVRLREAAKKDERRSRHRLQKFLLRKGVRRPGEMREWSESHRTWLSSLVFDFGALQDTINDLIAEVDHAKARIERLDKALDRAVAAAPATMQDVIAALQAMRGISKLTATTIVAELGVLSRFDHPRALMSLAGMVPSEHSSGDRQSRGPITRAGNAHLRRVVGEAAWHYRHRPRVIGKLRQRQQGLDSQVIDIAWKAQERLHKRYLRLSAKKCKQKAITAVGREMLGFIWAIAVHIERQAA